MGQILVGDLPGDIMERLQQEATAEGLTLEGYVRLLLERASASERDEFLAIADVVAESTRGRRQSDAVDLIREYRDGDTVADTVTIEDDLLARAREITGISSPDVLMQMGLQALVERSAARKLSQLGGSEPQLRNIPRRRAQQA